MINECVLKILNFGPTWNWNHKDGKALFSAVDHALINKVASVRDHSLTLVNYSDHDMIDVDLNISIPKSKENTITSRDFRAIRRNPQSFLMKLSDIKWESMVEMEDVNDMENFFTMEINLCLDSEAPWKTRKNEKRRYYLTKEMQLLLLERDKLEKIHKKNLVSGKIDIELERKFKKHNNYCNKLIKKAVRERTLQKITNESDVKGFWNRINGILKPETITKTETEDQVIRAPLELAEKFNVFFNEKAEKLALGIKKKTNIDPLLKLRHKLDGSNLKFKLRTVKEKEVLKIIQQLKTKKGYGQDGITSEILKLGANILVVPLSYIINTLILTGKFPQGWKLQR